MKYVPLKRVKVYANSTETLPPWTDASNWNRPQYYATIRAADVNGDGKQELFARSADGIETWTFDPATGQWDQIGSSGCGWSDAAGWAQAQYYSTIHAVDINGDGIAELIGRNTSGIQA